MYRTLALALFLTACTGPADKDTAGGGGDATAGAEVYTASCAACHGATGQGQVGPPLDATAEPGRISDAHVAELVTRGSLRMPPVGAAWGDADVEAVGAYLRSLRAP